MVSYLRCVQSYLFMTWVDCRMDLGMDEAGKCTHTQPYSSTPLPNPLRICHLEAAPLSPKANKNIQVSLILGPLD